MRAALTELLVAAAFLVKKPNSISSFQTTFLFGIVLIFPLLLLAILPRWTVDDAFISYRYGANLAHFGELSWNVGLDPVEGYTGIFLPLLTALILRLGLPLLITIKVISALAAGGTALLSLQMVRRMGGSLPFQIATVASLLLAPLVYVHLSSGLETTVFTFFLLAGAVLHFNILQNGISGLRQFIHPIVLLLLSLTRPEGVLFALLSLAFLFPRQKKSGKLLPFFIASSIWLLPAIFYFVWRLNYYGEWLPNSFAAKQFHGLINPESIKELGRFVAQYAALPLLAAGLLYVAELDQVREKWALRKLFFAWITPLSLFIAGCCLVYFRSDLYMNYASRFFAPFFPIAIIFSMVMGQVGWQHLRQAAPTHPQRYRTISRLLIALIIMQVGIYGFKWKGELGFVNYYQSIVEDEYIPVANWLRDNLPPDATIICYLDAGAIPYYSGLRAVDMGKLNDAYLARNTLEQPAIIDYFYSRKADAIIMSSEDEKRYVYNDEATAIREDFRFSHYKLTKVFGNEAGFPYFQWLYVRSPY